MIKLIIFDLCGVVFHCEEPPFFRYFSKEYNYPLERVEEVFSSNMKKAELGEISAQEAIGNFLKHFGVEASPKEMLKKLSSFKRINQDTLEIIKKLKGRYKLAYLTNSSLELMGLSEERLPIKQYFDFGIISEEIRARKPDPIGFNLIVKEFNVMPDETVFIDDAAKNLANAKNIGIKTILFTDKLADDLKVLGVEI